MKECCRPNATCPRRTTASKNAEAEVFVFLSAAPTSTSHRQLAQLVSERRRANDHHQPGEAGVENVLARCKSGVHHAFSDHFGDGRADKIRELNTNYFYRVAFVKQRDEERDEDQ